MNDTPRTDRAGEDGMYSTMVNHALKLELELNEATKQRDDLMTMLDKITEIAERVDGWESFPSKPIDQAHELMESIKLTNKTK